MWSILKKEKCWRVHGHPTVQRWGKREKNTFTRSTWLSPNRGKIQDWYNADTNWDMKMPIQNTELFTIVEMNSDGHGQWEGRIFTQIVNIIIFANIGTTCINHHQIKLHHHHPILVDIAITTTTAIPPLPPSLLPPPQRLLPPSSTNTTIASPQ